MKLSKYTLFLLLLMVFASCSKDLGNYEYTEINEVKIANVKADYTVRTGIDTLRIKPTIAVTMNDADTTRYKHLWILQRGAKDLDTIALTKDLEYVPRLAPAAYNIYYRLIDKKTEVTWVANTKMNVTTAYSKGLLIMGEDENGNAEAEMLSMLGETVHIKGILSKSGVPALKKPVSFVHSGGTYAVKLWAFTETGSFYLDLATLLGTATNNFNRMLFISDALPNETLFPILLAPQVITGAGAISSTLYRAMITQGRDVFASFPQLSGGDFFNNPVNRVATDPATRLPAAPYLLYTLGSMNSITWYDTLNQRFMNYTGFYAVAYSTPLVDDATTPGRIFPWVQPAGRTLKYAENTRNIDGSSPYGNSYAIMKDADNTHRIYKFYANGTNLGKRGAYVVKPIATNFDQASFYAFSSRLSVVFYTVGNKLYAYDFTEGNEKIYQFPEIGNDEITMLKFDTQVDYTAGNLYVATYNTTDKGTLRRFRVGTDVNLVSIQLPANSTWTDMLKIKDVNWRATN